MKRPTPFDDYLSLFRQHGGTSEDYLKDHFERFRKTLDEFNTSWVGGKRVLDIGAHWLHQAVMWRQGGFEVMAVELPVVFQQEPIRRIAHIMNIQLHECSDLGSAKDLQSIPDDSADVVLFAEILEHITFNPIPLWSEVHRILAPGGKILVTTPNYYSWRGRAWQPLRFLLGRGGGISVDEIIGTHTYAHHWREFSLREVVNYFRTLSPDFVATKAKILPTYKRSVAPWKSAIQATLDTVPLLRPNLHVEISLPAKTHGVTAKASW
ncbi:class I SAM-dependent methyltransferase [Dyella sp. OK004]|uniref:class I SAM-dependent methyltransferase n=1 Tax=Dyella sp. OK004 TaxID=1855292 RepID=UPI0015A5800A|nr:class I SAM-dependent methyltransferase [Dyella sp. OK004]